MAVAAAVSGVFHCAPMSIAPALSNKADYPTTIRTQAANVCKFFFLFRYMKKKKLGMFSPMCDV
jgi:hypothetical protein